MTDKYGKIHTDGSRSGGQPLDDSIEAKAQALVDRLRYDCHLATQLGDDARIVLPAIDARTIISRIEAQAAEIERLRAEAEAHYDRGYYDGSTHPIVRHDALREALADLLHAVCGEKGFAEAVRRDSGRIYPWPALELAEAKALAALEQSK
jgi:hypothetical protein